ncbi:ectonucleoside triphosphate diphosphohydrolase 1 isoform X3 [Protopterus annectens]|nr:ectonucleoside triphosphate diphosphohydrolase 1 isoform X3 [Protopterus annectens]XP_043912867.1 ectonucleoside triphosphate diphosphohydrolase 1 isoform X3 [Protopterus annectens]XP_043912868.1 ectonucleoside triphosphate diphosphohydrolase 1 isoform X3 [Protopterus annectens]XP_043912869.1 ectonucleoside triphosphate diphosphohydrolase 1 isoform X3 [Protopterus annectens]
MEQKNPWHRKTILCILFLFLLGIVALVCIGVIQNRPLPENVKYGIVLDAGSSHTSVFVYSWPGEKENDTGVVKQVTHCNVNGSGISSYANKVQNAGKSLQNCMDKAMEDIPKRRHSETPVYLGATAGMRLLELQNATLSDGVLASVKHTLSSYPFNFQGARIISGQEEGAYGWITINYLLETFFEPQSIFRSELTNTYGALDLGGASTQITFVPEEQIESPQNLSYFRLYGRSYNVYTHSYLCYGKDQALRVMLAKQQQESNGSNIIRTPCFYKDFEMNYTDVYSSPCTASYLKEDMNSNISILVVGEGDAEKCRQNLKNLFNKSTCRFSNCGFNDVFQPHVFGKFGAFSAFYYVMRTLNASDTPLPLHEIKERTKVFCKKTWQQVKQENAHVKEKYLKYLMETCFSANYILMLLEYGYKFSNETWENIEFRRKIKNTDAGWTLGYMLNLTNMIPAESKQQPLLPYGGYVTLMVLFSIFLLVVLLMGLICFQRRSCTTGKYSI